MKALQVETPTTIGPFSNSSTKAMGSFLVYNLTPESFQSGLSVLPFLSPKQ